MRIALLTACMCWPGQDTGISSKAMSIMNSFINDIFEKIGAETAVRSLLLPLLLKLRFWQCICAASHV